MGQVIIALGLRVLLRIGGINPIHVGGLEDGAAAHLGCAQDGRGIGGEVGISGAAGEHDDALLVEMAQRARALTPDRSMAASRTSAFITVASMPMASAVGRDRPFSEICAPRNTLPPPTTTPSAMPSLWAAIRSAAKRSMVG